MRLSFMHHSRRKLTLQYFLSYFVVVILVLSLLMGYAYSNFYSFHKEKLMQQYRERMMLLNTYFNKQIDQMHAATGQMMINSNMRPFRFPNDISSVFRIKELIDSYKATITDVYAIFLRFYDGEAVVGSNGTYLTENFIEKEVLFSDISENKLLDYFDNTTEIKLMPVQQLSGYIVPSGEAVLPIFMPMRAVNNERSGTVLFLIKYSTLEKQIISALGENTDVFILNEDRLILSNAASSIPFEMITSGNGVVEYDNRDYHVLHLQGGTYGLEYYVLLPESEVSTAMFSSLRAMIFAAAIVMAVSLVLINYLVQRSIRPIQMLRSMFTDSKSAGNELIEIRNYIQSLIEEKQTILARVEDSLLLHKADFVRRFLTNGFEDTDELFIEAEEIKLNVDRAYYVVGVIAKPTEMDYELLPEKINCLFDSEVSGVSSPGMQGRLQFLAFADDQEALFSFLKKKFVGLRASCVGISMAVSGLHSDYREGRQAYLEADHAFEMRFIKGNTEIIAFTRDDESDASILSANRKTIDRLRAALQAGDNAGVAEALHKLSIAIRNTHASVFTFRCLYNDILNLIHIEAQHIGMDDTYMFDLYRLSQCLSWEEMDQMLHDLCSRLMKKKTITSETVEDGTAAEVKRIIEKRFNDPELSISEIVQSVSMIDARQFANEFKRAYHMTPSDFLIGKRMANARRLLRETDMPVKDIALECGYYDVTAFNRRFKAYMNMPPQQYRTQYAFDASTTPEDKEEFYS